MGRGHAPFSSSSRLSWTNALSGKMPFSTTSCAFWYGRFSIILSASTCPMPCTAISASRLEVFNISAACSLSPLVVGAVAKLGDFLLPESDSRSRVRLPIASDKDLRIRRVRSRTSARVNFPRFGASSSPTMTPKPSPVTKPFMTASLVYAACGILRAE